MLQSACWCLPMMFRNADTSPERHCSISVDTVKSGCAAPSITWWTLVNISLPMKRHKRELVKISLWIGEREP